jgi:hypothetical protein
MRVIGVNQINFPRPMPVLQLLLPRNRRCHVREQFIMNKAVNAVFRGKTIGVFIAMLIDTLHQIGRNSDVKRAIKATRKDIDAGLFLFSHRLNNAAKWTLKQVQGNISLKNQRHLPNHRHPELVSGSIGRLAQFKQRERSPQDEILRIMV